GGARRLRKQFVELEPGSGGRSPSESWREDGGYPQAAQRADDRSSSLLGGGGDRRIRHQHRPSRLQPDRDPTQRRDADRCDRAMWIVFEFEQLQLKLKLKLKPGRRAATGKHDLGNSRW